MTSRASIVSAERHKAAHPSWTLRIRPESYPTLFECFEIISHDSGGGAGHPYHLVDHKWSPYLPDFEAAVAALSKEDRKTFCIGEATEAEEIAARCELLTSVSALFEEWFDA